jgi:multiple sugar transport system substrate-binding protein
MQRRSGRLWRVTTIAALIALAGATAGCLGRSSNSSSGTVPNADAKEFTLTIADNAIAGGKNAAGAEWITNWVIPKFIADQKAKGFTAHVNFQGSGAGDEDYKAKVALDLKTGSGADIYNIDGLWFGEFAEAGYIKPLADTVGAQRSDAWDGWAQIPPAIQNNAMYNGKRYGIPEGTDGRVIYFNKKLFAQAGLPEGWQPRSWDDILAAAQTLKTKLPGVTPLQLDAGTAMGEATTMQGILPLLVGAGQPIYANNKWQGDTSAVRDVLTFYQKVYGGGLGDPILQEDAKGRDKSFAEFAAGKIGILFESDYFWRSVVEPTQGIAKMPDRDQTVGYTLIPAMKSGSGIKGQSYVSMSGGSGRIINPSSKYPVQAWELLEFMNSKDATIAQLAGKARITQRNDVNNEVLSKDPMLSFIARKVLPITAFRPGLAVYPRVSLALQQATLDVVTGKSPADAASTYTRSLATIVGGDKVASG